MTDEYRPRNPIPSIVILLMLAGGGWYFLQHYQISGLDGISIRGKPAVQEGYDDLNLQDDFVSTSSRATAVENSLGYAPPNAVAAGPAAKRRGNLQVRNLRIASWSLSGLDTTRLADETTRENLIRIIRQFDLVAVQQLAHREQDLLPRLVNMVNEGNHHYEYMLGDPTGPADQQERLGFLFDTARLQIDRTQSYKLADPEDHLSFDPLVAWFRALGPNVHSAWTFSLVNVRVDLARAPQEVDLLPHVISAVRFDGRGEDDVVLAGMFQADDAYLLAKVGDGDTQAAVHSTPTDIVGKHQISNLLMNTKVTSEYVGRGGVFDFLRTFNLSLDEAEAVSSQLPVYAEFTATEGLNF
jgi:hypothetical protein